MWNLRVKEPDFNQTVVLQGVAQVRVGTGTLQKEDLQLHHLPSPPCTYITVYSMLTGEEQQQPLQS